MVTGLLALVYLFHPEASVRLSPEATAGVLEGLGSQVSEGFIARPRRSLPTNKAH